MFLAYGAGLHPLEGMLGSPSFPSWPTTIQSCREKIAKLHKEIERKNSPAGEYAIC